MEDLLDEDTNAYIKFEEQDNRVGEIDVDFSPGGTPIFRPTVEQFSMGLRECMKAMSPTLREYGIGKIVPPTTPDIKYTSENIARPSKESEQKRASSESKSQQQLHCAGGVDTHPQRDLPPEIADMNPQNSSVCNGRRPPNPRLHSQPPWSHIDYDKTVPSVLIQPTTQALNGSKGCFQVAMLRKKKKVKVIDFWNRAKQQDALRCPVNSTSEDGIERAFWKSLNTLKKPAEYASDMLGSLFGDDPASGWNLDNLDTELKECLEQDLPGVTRAYLYFGMWRSLFAWHKEDMDLLSINYLHFGAPKTWYGIAPELAKRFEALAEGLYGDERRNCRQFLRHKTTVITPKKLKECNIPYTTVTQFPGEFVVTYASAYHSGFNHGFNCAEAVNFATPAWIPFGHKAGLCKCWPDTVRINMYHFEDTFRLKVGLTPLYHYVKVIDGAENTRKRERDQDETPESSPSKHSKYDMGVHQVGVVHAT